MIAPTKNLLLCAVLIAALAPALRSQIPTPAATDSSKTLEILQQNQNETMRQLQQLGNQNGQLRIQLKNKLDTQTEEINTLKQAIEDARKDQAAALQQQASDQAAALKKQAADQANAQRKRQQNDLMAIAVIGIGLPVMVMGGIILRRSRESSRIALGIPPVKPLDDRLVNPTLKELRARCAKANSNTVSYIVRLTPDSKLGRTEDGERVCYAIFDPTEQIEGQYPRVRIDGLPGEYRFDKVLPIVVATFRAPPQQNERVN